MENCGYQVEGLPQKECRQDLEKKRGMMPFKESGGDPAKESPSSAHSMQRLRPGYCKKHSRLVFVSKDSKRCTKCTPTEAMKW